MYVKKFTKLMLLWSLPALVIACGSASGAPRDPLAGTQWQVVRIGGADRISGTELSLSFAEGQAGGHSGCNSFGGSYEIEGDRLVFRELTLTLMACMEPEGVMDQEAAYLDALNSTERFEIRNGSMVLFHAQGERILFSRSEAG